MIWEEKLDRLTVAPWWDKTKQTKLDNKPSCSSTVSILNPTAATYKQFLGFVASFFAFAFASV